MVVGVRVGKFFEFFCGPPTIPVRFSSERRTGDGDYHEYQQIVAILEISSALRWDIQRDIQASSRSNCDQTHWKTLKINLRIQNQFKSYNPRRRSPWTIQKSLTRMNRSDLINSQSFYQALKFYTFNIDHFCLFKLFFLPLSSSSPSKVIPIHYLSSITLVKWMFRIWVVFFSKNSIQFHESFSSSFLALLDSIILISVVMVQLLNFSSAITANLCNFLLLFDYARWYNYCSLFISSLPSALTVFFVDIYYRSEWIHLKQVPLSHFDKFWFIIVI